MASKSRGGLSKREFAAQVKVKSAPKSSSRSVAKPKSVAPLVGAGPLLPGQSRVAPLAGPSLPGKVKPGYYDYSNNSVNLTGYKEPSTRELASKSKSKSGSSKSSGLSGGKSVSFGDSNGGSKTNIQKALGNGLSLSTPKSTPANKGGSGILDLLKNAGAGLMRSFGEANVNRSLGLASDNAFLTDSQRRDNFNKFANINDANAQEEDGMSALGIALRKGSQPDIPTGYGDNGEIFFNGAKPRETFLKSDFATPGTNFSRPGSEQAYSRGEDPRLSNKGSFGVPLAVTSTAPRQAPYSAPSYDYTPNNRNDSRTNEFPNPRIQDNPVQQKILAALETQNQFPQDGSMQYPTSTRGNASGRGSGMFGTGKGVQGDDPYIKELRKAYSSNGGEKWLRKQFDELIKSLDPTYAQMQKEGEDALQAQLLNNNTQLASVMNANNVGDSEQRAQLMAGQQRDTQTALGNLLAKLATAKAGDVSQYKQQYATQRGQLDERNQTNQRALLEKIQAYRNQQQDGAGRGMVAQTMKTPKVSRNDVFNWVEDALGKGYSWQEIADNAKEQGIGTETGGYLDQLLNNANKQNRYAR